MKMVVREEHDQACVATGKRPALPAHCSVELAHAIQSMRKAYGLSSCCSQVAGASAAAEPSEPTSGVRSQRRRSPAYQASCHCRIKLRRPWHADAICKQVSIPAAPGKARRKDKSALLHATQSQVLVPAKRHRQSKGTWQQYKIHRLRVHQHQRKAGHRRRRPLWHRGVEHALVGLARCA